MGEVDLLAHMALTQVPQIGDMQIAQLLKYCGSPAEVFKTSKRHLEQIPGIGEIRAASIRSFHSMDKVKKEMEYVIKNHIQVLVKGMDEYPKRLEYCIDAPHVLYYKGNANLNAHRTLSIVGTRAPTEYGRDRVVQLMDCLSLYDITVISGLAYGVDTIAHREALKHDLKTMAVLGHGFNFIYPHSNRQMAGEIIEKGGLLTEFMHTVKPDRQNFPRRNRIVAGISDVVIVVESGEKGGSLITADIANSYNKDVLAYPGRAIDLQSMGCNQLIRLNRANLINTGEDVLRFMNWDDKITGVKKIQRELFVDLEENEKKVYDLLNEQGHLHVDQITSKLDLRPSQASGILLGLEMKNLLASLPGNVYGLSGF